MKRFSYYLVTLLLVNIFYCGFAQDRLQNEKVVIESDGWQLRGDLLLTKAMSPAVLLLNKANGDRNVYKELAVELARNGISSLRIDLRGHGESINKGKFIPFDSLNNLKLNLDSGYTDIIAAHKYLASLEHIDSNRIGIVGASYSGEQMMLAYRNYRMAKSYVALSPGSFSEESIASIDMFLTPMLFIKSIDERSMLGFETNLFLESKTAMVLIVPGKLHATDILQAFPKINTLISDWFKRNL